MVAVVVMVVVMIVSVLYDGRFRCCCHLLPSRQEKRNKAGIRRSGEVLSRAFPRYR